MSYERLGIKIHLEIINLAVNSTSEVEKQASVGLKPLHYDVASSKEHKMTSRCQSVLI